MDSLRFCIFDIYAWHITTVPTLHTTQINDIPLNKKVFPPVFCKILIQHTAHQKAWPRHCRYQWGLHFCTITCSGKKFIDSLYLLYTAHYIHYKSIIISMTADRHGVTNFLHICYVFGHDKEAWKLLTSYETVHS